MLLIRNANIKTMAGPDLKNGCLLLENGKIAAVGQTVDAPEGVETLDAQGRLLTPGCVEAHCHIGLDNEGMRWEGMDYNEIVEPLTPQLRAIDSINPQDEAFGLALRGGVTTACTGPGSANVVGGTFVIVKLAGKRVDRMILRAPAAMKCAFGENPKGCYGQGLKKSPMTRMAVAALLRELCKMDFRWIRLHYLYPEIIDDELIDLIANEDKIVKYLDIPIQHINNDILRRMNRHCTGDEIRALLQKLRARIPGLVLRTSLITGLPGEGEAEFEELCTWLREVRLERVGVFPFSPEEGTPAAVMTDRCEPDEAQRRADLILELQAGIMDDYNAACIGRDMTVLCEHRARSGMCSGRTYADSPEIDGTVYFTGAAQPGDMVTVHITGCDDGDLAGEQIHE